MVQQDDGKSDAPAPERDDPRLGERVRDIRGRLGLTLAQAGKRTGISISTLSKVENGQMSLTYDKILQVATGLGVDIAELFAAPPPAYFLGRRSYSPPDDGMPIKTRNYDYVYLCTELAGKGMIPIVARLNSRTMKEFGPFIRHSGEEYVYVIAGTVAFHCELYKPLIMPTGASLYFDARMGHAYLNAGPAPAKILCVCTAPEAELAEIEQRLLDPV